MIINKTGQGERNTACPENNYGKHWARVSNTAYPENNYKQHRVRASYMSIQLVCTSKNIWAELSCEFGPNVHVCPSVCLCMNIHVLVCTCVCMDVCLCSYVRMYWSHVRILYSGRWGLDPPTDKKILNLRLGPPGCPSIHPLKIVN